MSKTTEAALVKKITGHLGGILSDYDKAAEMGCTLARDLSKDARDIIAAVDACRAELRAEAMERRVDAVVDCLRRGGSYGSSFHHDAERLLAAADAAEARKPTS